MEARATPAMLLAGLLLAGCAAPGAPPAPPADQGEPEHAAAPRVDAGAVVRGLRDFVAAYPYRQAGAPSHVAARGWLAEGFRDAGLEVVRQSFPVASAGLPLSTGENIVGLRWGADRSRWVVVAGHYDDVEQAGPGAYDDGGGTLMVAHLAAAFAHRSADRTIAFVHLDAEDRGLQGSRAFALAMLEGTFPHRARLDAVIDLDMVGITWPHPAPLGVWVNDAALEAQVEALRRAAGVPDANVEYRVPNGGRTHAAAFVDAGIPSVSLWSQMDKVVLADGTPVPGAYPFWHLGDTFEGMVATAGDEATLTAGFQTVLDIVAPLVAHAASPAYLAAAGAAR